jgi:peptidoglycan/LPS O-acetylase OafA/YrhL
MVQLDALRAIGLALVIMQHCFLPGHPAYDLELGDWALQMFFVQSGFLITGILLRAREGAEAQGASRWSPIGPFYARRALRIFPAYYLVLLVAYAADIHPVRESIGWHLAYLSNVYVARQGEWPGAVSHLWSLSVEEQFYLLWPLIVLSTPRARLATVMVAAMLVAPVFRIVTFVATGGDGFWAWLMMPSLLDKLALGGLLALSWRADPAVQPFRHRMIGYALPVGLVSFALGIAGERAGGLWDVQSVFTRDAGYALVNLWLVDRAAKGFTGAAGQVLTWRPMVAVGGVSYGGYLWHNFVAPLVDHLDELVGRPYTIADDGLVRFLWVLVLTILAAGLSWQLVEGPLNRLKTGIAYVPAGRRQPQAVSAP